MESVLTDGINDSYFVHQFVDCSGLCFFLKNFVQALRLCTVSSVYRGCSGIAVLYRH